MGRIVGIIQARMGSTRLPGKVLAKVGGKPLLGYLLDRVDQSQRLDGVVVATTDRDEDEAIEQFCLERGVACYRGSSEDVLGRYWGAAKEAGAEVVVRLTGDNPLIDPEMIDWVVGEFVAADVDYASNTLERGFARGMDVEVFTIGALERAQAETDRPYDREHVTPYFYGNPDKFRLKSVEQRLTVDTREDLERIRQVIERADGTRYSHLVEILEEIS